MEIIETQYGKFTFYVDNLHSCCGVAVVHGCRFYKDRLADRIDFYNAIHKELVNREEPYDLARCKLLMSDAVRSETSRKRYCSIYDFCMSMGWTYGPATFNRKSGNKMVLFEFDKNPNSVRL